MRAILALLRVRLTRAAGCSAGTCTVEGVLPGYRKMCDNRPFCFAYAHVETDPCPEVSKYLEIIYSCEQKGGVVFSNAIQKRGGERRQLNALCRPTVCLHGLGVEDGNITNSQISASSSTGGNTPDKARLNGNSCWMPSGARM